MYARVIKILGSLNVLVYCNDNKTRLCHIRGSMRKKVWINLGDIVLISARDFEKGLSESGKTYEKGDVVAKYDTEHLGRLKKMDDVNKKLFLQLETSDGAVLSEIGKRESTRLPQSEEDLGVVFDEEARKSEKSEESEDSAEESEHSNKEIDIDDI